MKERRVALRNGRLVMGLCRLAESGSSRVAWQRHWLLAGNAATREMAASMAAKKIKSYKLGAQIDGGGGLPARAARPAHPRAR